MSAMHMQHVVQARPSPIRFLAMRAVPVVPDHPVRWVTSDAILVLLGTQILSFVWAGMVIVALLGGEVPDPLSVSLLVLLNVGLWAGYGLGPAFVARAKGNGPIADFGATIERVDVPLGLMLGVVTQVVVLPLLYLPIGWLTDDDPSESAQALIDGIDGPLEAVLLFVSVAVMAPLVEELFYRGLLLRALQRRLGSVPAVALSALIFAAVHRELLLIPGLFLFGVLAAVLTLRSGRLGPAWALHVGFNVATLVLIGVL